MDNNEIVMYDDNTDANGDIRNAIVNTVTASPDDIRSALIVANAINDAYSLNDAVAPDTTLFVTDIIVVPITRVDDSGNRVNAEGTYLVCADGNAYYSQSAGIARSAKLIAAVTSYRLGKDSPDGYIPVKVCVKQTNGRTYKTLRAMI